MQKQAPSLGRILTMAAFALSCFGLLLYLWLSFGGPVPLKPSGYRVEVSFPQANQLAFEGDVRISGVKVGTVKDKRRDDGRTVATIQVDERYAPLPADTRAILRTKTILGETYVELTPGTRGAEVLPEGARLPVGQVERSVQFDEILDALDPTTRRALQTWQRDFGRAAANAGDDLNAAAAHAPEFTLEATDLLETLDQQEREVRTLVRSTGEVLGAVNERQGSLRELVRTSGAVFEETAARQEALAESVRILPTFLDEARLTLQRTESFAAKADPLVQELGPAVRELRPALRDARALAPDVERFYRALEPTARTGESALPAARDLIVGLAPVLGATGPLLSELNPILEWLEYNQRMTQGVFANAPSALLDTYRSPNEVEVGHYLRSLSPAGLESLAIHPERLPIARGNAYLSPSAYAHPDRSRKLGLPSWDCDNTGKGEFTTQKGGTNDLPSCWRLGFPGWKGAEEPGQFPHIERADYSR